MLQDRVLLRRRPPLPLGTHYEACRSTPDARRLTTPTTGTAKTRPDGNHGGRTNYAPNSFDDPVADHTYNESSYEVSGPIGRFDYEPQYKDTDAEQPAGVWNNARRR